MAPTSSTRDKVTKRNATGAVGVHLATETDARYPDCQYVSYVASWMTEGGKRRNIRFLVSKYGKKAALTLAKLARQKQLADRESAELFVVLLVTRHREEAAAHRVLFVRFVGLDEGGREHRRRGGVDAALLMERSRRKKPSASQH